MAEISPAMTREYKETLVVPQFEFDRPSRIEASRHDCPMYAASRFLVLFGAACLTVVVLPTFAEMLAISPGRGWGMPNGPGISLDFVRAAETVKSASAREKFSGKRTPPICQSCNRPSSTFHNGASVHERCHQRYCLATGGGLRYPNPPYP